MSQVMKLNGNAETIIAAALMARSLRKIYLITASTVVSLPIKLNLLTRIVNVYHCISKIDYH
jgi:hypothetical protein